MRNAYQYVLDLETASETCRLARESVYEAQGQQKHQYNKKTKSRQFEVGHKVLVLLPTEHNKLTLQWRGQYMVREVVNRMEYK